MDDTGISRHFWSFLLVYSLSAIYKWHSAHARPSSTDRRRYAQKPLHRAVFIRACFYRERFVHRSFYTQMPLHTEAFTQRGFYTQKRALRPNLHCCCLNSCQPFCFLFLITHLSRSPSQASVVGFLIGCIVHPGFIEDKQMFGWPHGYGSCSFCCWHALFYCCKFIVPVFCCKLPRSFQDYVSLQF